jgi:DNA replication and repair protein RecF
VAAAAIKNPNSKSIAKILKLNLSYFRNYINLNLQPDVQSNIIVITGPNGSGKTNILEAISLLSPGRGIRGCKLFDMQCNLNNSTNYWYLDSQIDGFYGPMRVETWLDKHENIVNDENKSKRCIKINDNNVKNQAELTKLLSISWITPQMDQVFISSSSIRRKFLDRIVLNFEVNHAKHLMAYEHSMKERARLLKNKNYDMAWLSALENNMAQMAILIATSRVQITEYIQEVMLEINHPFPKARISVLGDIELKVHKVPAVQLEDEYKDVLRKNRNIDAATGRTNAGIHKSDLVVYYITKNLPADKCSTGEQKSLLLSIFLAEIFAQIKWRGQTPILLLDEVLAHLDEERRDILCQIIKDIKAQTWITGTDNDIFVPIKDESQFFGIKNSQLISY